VTAAPIAERGRPTLRSKVVARTSLYALLGANVVVVTVLFIAAGASGSLLITIGRLAGLYGALLMAFQLLLVARVPWLDRRLGMDSLTTWHRWTGFSLLCLLVGHLVFILFGYGEIGNHRPVDELVQLANTVEGVLRALVAFALILVAGVLSARFARKRIADETWHFIHLSAYAAVVLAFSHEIALGQSFTSSPFARAYWWTLWITDLGAVLLGRVVLPMWRNLRHQLRVTAVVPESPTVVSVYLAGKRLDELPVRSGQFFRWRFLTHADWRQANPFSLSAAPDGKSLRLTAKALADGSSGLRALKAGTRVFAEGPYGAFTTIHQRQPNALLVAGGVGITPIRALLEDIAGQVVVLYRTSSDRDAVLLPELRQLAHARGAIVEVLTGPSSAGGAHGPLLGAGNIQALVPDVAARDVFVCGPPGMTGAVLRSLRELGVPGPQVHAERFSLAG
jgi:predicted ferric reductase